MKGDDLNKSVPVLSFFLLPSSPLSFTLSFRSSPSSLSRLPVPSLRHHFPRDKARRGLDRMLTFPSFSV